MPDLCGFDFVVERQLGHFDLIAKEYGDGVRAALTAAATEAKDTISHGDNVAAE